LNNLEVLVGLELEVGVLMEELLDDEIALMGQLGEVVSLIHHLSVGKVQLFHLLKHARRSDAGKSRERIILGRHYHGLLGVVTRVRTDIRSEV